MTFPILPAHELGLVLAVLIGFGFGFVLERAGFGRANKLAAQFYGHDMTVFKVMFSAIVTAMLGVMLASAVGLADFKALADHATSTTFLVPMIAGGFLLGAGFIVSGYCPGTSFVAMASGKLDGLRDGARRHRRAGHLGRARVARVRDVPQRGRSRQPLPLGAVRPAGELRPVHRRGRRDGHGRRLLLRRGEARARPRRSGRPVRRRDARGAARALRVRRPRHRAALGLVGLALPTGAREATREATAITPLALARRVFDEPWKLRVLDLRPLAACSAKRSRAPVRAGGEARRARARGRDGATRPRARRGRAAHRSAGGGRRVPRPRVRLEGGWAAWRRSRSLRRRRPPPAHRRQSSRRTPRPRGDPRRHDRHEGRSPPRPPPRRARRARRAGGCSG